MPLGERLEERRLLSASPLLPDLTVWNSVADEFLHGWILETDSATGQDRLRLSVATPNIGAGPMELRGGDANADGTQDVFQRIYDDQGGYEDLLAGTFEFHDAHGHIHFEDWAAYRLRAVVDADQVGEVVAASDKVSFCLIDSLRYDTTLPGAPATRHYNTCEDVQGLSVGWADVYPRTLPDQWIDVTNVADGDYWLEVEVDPLARIAEVNEANNVERVLIALDRTGGDAFEPNDSLSEAADFGTGDQSHAGLSIHRAEDVDFFRWRAGEAAGSLTVDAIFAHADGDIDLLLTDSELQELGRSTSSSDNESVTIDVVPGQEVIIHVYGVGGTAGMDYDLLINGPDATLGDAFEPNNVFSQAAFLGTGDQTRSALSIHDAADVDHFQWQGSTPGELTVRLLFSHADGDLDLVLRDANENELGRSASAVDNEQVTIQIAAAQTVFIEALGVGGAVNAYTLVLDGPDFAGGDVYSNLVGYWNFDGDALDQATQGASSDDGELFGDATMVRGGLGWAALDLHGNGDLVRLPTSLDVNRGTHERQTIALWFYPRASDFRQVVYQQGGALRGVNVYVENGEVYAGAWNGDLWEGTWLRGAVTPDAWNHVALVLDSQAASDALRLYINGLPIAGGLAYPLHGQHPAAIGGAERASRYFDAAAGFVTSSQPYSFRGFVDDLRIYARPLDPFDVEQLSSGQPVRPETATTDVTSELVTYWDFEGDLVDRGGWGVSADDGELVADAALASLGLGAGALELGGNGGRLRAPTSADVNQGARPLQTISLWFYPRDVDTRQTVYQQGGGWRGMNIYLEDGALWAGAWNGDLWQGTWLTGTVTPAAWNHAALVLDASQGENGLRLYVNGLLQDSGFAAELAGHHPATVGSAEQSSRYFHAADGFEKSAAANSFRGFVDDVRIYQRALAAVDVQDLSRAHLTAPEVVEADVTSRLATYWDFEQGPLDAAPFGLQADDGQLVGDAALVAGGLGSAALETDGQGDMLRVPGSLDINRGPRDELTLALWFLPAAPLDEGRQVVYEQGGAWRGINIYLEGGVLYAGAWNGDLWEGTWLAAAVESGVWNHVTLVLNANAPTDQLTLLVQGDVAAVGFADHLSGHNPAALGAADGGSRYRDAAVGFESSQAANGFRGLIDEVRIYDRILQPRDIRALAGDRP